MFRQEYKNEEKPVVADPEILKLKSCFTPDAFARPLEHKGNAPKDYKKLYNQDALISQYVKPSQEELKLEDDVSKKFQNQFYQVMDALNHWGKENGVSSALIEKLNDCKRNFFDASYSGGQSTQYFSTVKQNLENIWFILTGDDSVPLKKKQDLFKELCSNLHVCAPGLYTHIEETLNKLTVDISLARWLAELRTNIIRQYAELHIKEFDVAAGNSIHVYNAFLIYASSEGWNPLSAADKCIDPFATAHTHVDDNEVIKFHSYYENAYTAEAIVNCLQTNFICELNEFKKANAIKENKEGWIPYSADLFKKVDLLSDVLGVQSEHGSFFDIQDDLVRFNPCLFRAAFLKACQKNEKLFAPGLWREFATDDGYKIISFNNQVSWSQTPDEEHLDWQNLPAQANKFELISNLLAKHKLEEWHVIINASVKKINTVIKNSIDLANFIHKLVNKDDAYKFLDLYLGKENLNTLLSNRKHILALFDVMAPADRGIPLEDLNLIFEILSICEKDFLAEAVEQNDTASLKRLIKQVRATPRPDKDANVLLKIAVKHGNVENIKLLTEFKFNINETAEHGRTLLHTAIEYNHAHVVPVLVELKADLKRVDDNGYTPVEYATLFGRPGMVKALVDLGAKKTDLPCNGDIKHFINSGRWDVVSLMLKLGPLKSDEQKIPSVVLAGKRGNIAAIRLLAEFKTNVALSDADGNTAAHAAAQAGHTAIINELVVHQISFSSLNSKHESPLDLAIKNQDMMMIKTLCQHKAISGENIKNAMKAKIEILALILLYAPAYYMERSLDDKTKAALQKNRNELVNAFITLGKKMDDAERKIAIEKVINSYGSALGVIVNTSRMDFISHKDSHKTIGVSRIISELKYIGNLTPEVEVKKEEQPKEHHRVHNKLSSFKHKLRGH